MPHPDFAGNRRIYLSFVEGGPGGTSGAALGYGTLDLGNPAAPALKDFKVIWRQQPKVDGQRPFLASHCLRARRIPLPDLGRAAEIRLRRRTSSGNLGKVLRLTAEGAPAPGNPWASRGGVAAQFWTMGHRNVLGLQFAPDGRLWESEMGPQGGDEINLILPGQELRLAARLERQPL